MMRHGAAAALGAVFGVLPVSPVEAAPPASHDETLFVEEDRQGKIEPGGFINLVVAASYYPSTVAQHRTVVLKLPAGVTFRSAENDYAAGPCVPDATKRVVTCTTQDPVDERPALNATWFVTADLAEDLPAGEYVTVKTTINTEIPDPDLSNNVGTWKFFVPGPGDMSAAVSAPPGPWQAGSEFDAKLTVRNDSRYGSPAQLYVRVQPVQRHPQRLAHRVQADPGHDELRRRHDQGRRDHRVHRALQGHEVRRRWSGDRLDGPPGGAGHRQGQQRRGLPRRPEAVRFAHADTDRRHRGRRTVPADHRPADHPARAHRAGTARRRRGHPVPARRHA
ncbi:hypothetical protein ACIBSW_25495 [Actinoplanes sp. NPDC049668]|uniref:hypothetical protein n=1 Tax=unclassified Actinoplanes TaxID=2626549 RepID=UPI0033AB2D41